MSTVLANTINAVGGGASTVKINNDSTVVSDGGAVLNLNLVQGLAKAWLNQDGTASGAAERDSLNIGGITDNGTGSYTPAFTNSMGNANYTAQVHANNGTTDVSGAHDYGYAAVDRATGNYRIDIENASNSQTDMSLTDSIIHGDLA